MGNVEAKELICTTHGHELKGEGNAGGREREGGKVQRISSINGRQKNRQGEGKNSIGNVEAKELIMYDPWT